MKRSLVILTAVAWVGTAQAVDKAQLDQRVRILAAKLQALQSQPDKRIPADVLRRAEAVVLLDRTKAGFLFAFQGGGGVALVRDPGYASVESGRLCSRQRSQPGISNRRGAELLRDSAHEHKRNPRSDGSEFRFWRRGARDGGRCRAPVSKLG